MARRRAPEVTAAHGRRNARRPPISDTRPLVPTAVALTCGRKDIPQPADRVSGPPAAHRRNADIACGKNGAAGGIGVNEAPFRVDGPCPCCFIEGIDKCRDFAAELKHSAIRTARLMCGRSIAFAGARGHRRDRFAWRNTPNMAALIVVLSRRRL
jgi:hypothetical protein